MSPLILALFWIVPALFGRGGWTWFGIAILMIAFGSMAGVIAFEPRGELVSNERFAGLIVTIIAYLFLGFIYYYGPARTKTS